MVFLIASLALVTSLADGQLRGVGGRERHRVHLRARLPSVRAVTAEALDEAARRRAGSIPQPGPGEITHQWVPLVVHRRHARRRRVYIDRVVRRPGPWVTVPAEVGAARQRD